VLSTTGLLLLLLLLLPLLLRRLNAGQKLQGLARKLRHFEGKSNLHRMACNRKP
jgi:hypothetical protein